MGFLAAGAVEVVGFAVGPGLLSFVGPVDEGFAGGCSFGGGAFAAEPLLAVVLVARGGLVCGGFVADVVDLAAGLDEGVVVLDITLGAGVAVPAALPVEAAFDAGSFFGAADGAELVMEAALDICGLD